MYKFAVFGNPIEHSLSPIIWQQFATQCKIDIDYKKILATDNNDFQKKIKIFFADGGIGASITTPFKQQAVQIADINSSFSQKYNVANFVYKNEQQLLCADSTDSIGLITDLEHNCHFSLSDKRILIIGSGYVLDSILADLSTTSKAPIDCLARNQTRLEYLKNTFAISSFNPQQEYDLIINCSPHTTNNQLFAQITHLKDNTLVYDMVYASSYFLDKMLLINNNVKCISGIGMLVEQARIAFITIFPFLKPQSLEIIKLLEANYKIKILNVNVP
jgi:shikimate dehydrogenase